MTEQIVTDNSAVIVALEKRIRELELIISENHEDILFTHCSDSPQQQDGKYSCTYCGTQSDFKNLDDFPHDKNCPLVMTPNQSLDQAAELKEQGE